MGNLEDTCDARAKQALRPATAMIDPVRRLLPRPADDVTAAELAAAPREPVGDRPWVGLCMIASIDGSTVVEGRSAPLGNRNDTAILGALRAAADLVLVGAATVRHERYGAPRKAGQRLAVVTRTGDVDAHSELFASGAGFLIMPGDGPRAPEGPAGPLTTVRAGTGDVDLARALTMLGEIMEPPAFVHAEGGARLNGSLLDAGCVDEVNVTTSPHLAGGAGTRLTAGADDAFVAFRLDQLAIDDESFVFSRWIRR